MALLGTLGCGRIGFESSDARSDVPAPTPLVWLPMDETAGTILVDASGHGHHAVCAGGSCPSLGAAGAIATAAVFDGVDDYAKIDFATDLNVPTITVSLWANKISDGSGFAMLAARQRGTAEGELWDLFYDNTAAREYAWNGIRGGPSAGDIGRWMHVVGTHDGSAVRLYRNAVLVAEQTTTEPVAFDTTGIVIGAADNGTPSITEWANAVIDDVRIYATALSPAQIAALYLDGELGAHWHLDETTGTSFADTSNDSTPGTCNRCPTLGVPGKQRTAVSFAGGAVISGADVGYGPGNQISVAAWVRYDRAACAQECYVVAKSQFNGGTPYNLVVTLAGDALLYVDSITTNATTTGVDVGDGAWHHLIGTFDGAATAIYVDGVLRGSGTGTPTTNTEPTSIGSARADPAYRPFTGDIDDVRIYRRALTAAEAAMLYAIYD